jgi:probable HAF family extracellular repeat protein
MNLFKVSPHAVTAGAAFAMLAGCNGGASSVAPIGPLPQGIRVQNRLAHLADQPRYIVRNLGALGGSFGMANGISDREWVTGIANLPGDAISRAVLWTNDDKIDLGTLGGSDSSANARASLQGLIAGDADTASTDPLSENFCAHGTIYTCLGFIWKRGHMTGLSTLGGNNAEALGLNDRGEAVGIAENSVQDPSCIAPQVLDWEAVTWDPKSHKARELPPIAGDAVGAAIAINNRGQVTGGSGFCAPVSGAVSVHAILWQNGVTTTLPTLGGTINNYGAAIDDNGEIVGTSELAGNSTFHAALWKNKKILDLGTLPGDSQSSAVGINNRGQIVGVSCTQGSAVCRAFLWQNGVMSNLNTLVDPHTKLYLIYGADINDRGDIVGQALDRKTGKTPAFVAVPEGHASIRPATRTAPNVNLPEDVRRRFLDRRGFGIRPGASR